MKRPVENISRAPKQNLVATRWQDFTAKSQRLNGSKLNAIYRREGSYFIILADKIWILVTLQEDGSGF